MHSIGHFFNVFKTFCRLRKLFDCQPCGGYYIAYIFSFFSFNNDCVSPTGERYYYKYARYDDVVAGSLCSTTFEMLITQKKASRGGAILLYIQYT